MAISFERWEQVRASFLDQIIRTNNIPAELVHPFFDFYNTEFRPGYYSSLPCTCSGKTWSDMLNQVLNEYNAAKKEEEIRQLAAEKAAGVVSGREG